MRRVITLLSAVVVVAGAAVAAVLALGGDADATRSLEPELPGQLTPSPKALPEVREAAAGGRIEGLRVPGGRALLAKSPVRSDRAVLVLHGRGSVAGTIFARPARAQWVVGLLRNGYSVATADAGGDAWGDASSLRDYVDLARQLQERGMERITIVGTSMGGLASLQLLRSVRPVAYIGIYPVYDLGDLFRLGRFATSIRRAYGFRGDTLPPAAQQRAPVALPPLRGLPMLIEASPGDTTVPKATNADKLAEAARIAGGSVTEVTTEGEHGDPSNWDSMRTLAFLDKAYSLPAATPTSAPRDAP